MKLNTVDAIRFSADPHGMNWLREDMPYAQVRCPQGLESTVAHEMEGDMLHTEIRIANPSDKPYITKASDIGISLPIDTRYNETEYCLTSRAHVHLFCGGDISWVMAMRMGGDAPHLGMVLTQGSLAGYSVEHNGPLAHDRGKLILHPASAAWQPGEVKVWAWEIRHAERLLETDVHYPPFEVAFEQSIIGPAADVLLQVFQLTGEERYLRGAEVHLRLLELFNGHQPDYHCHEVALRNWDGYWFGKYKVFGDTFPHYWSGITANVFQRYADLTGHADYARRAENSRRGVMPLVFPDGRASCAYVYPMYSNGTRGGFYDPYANDQDWGLYFSLRFAK